MKAASHVLFCAAPVSLAVSASAQKISPAQGMPHGVGPAIGSALGLVLKSQLIHPQTQRITALRVVYEDFTTIDALPPSSSRCRQQITNPTLGVRGIHQSDVAGFIGFRIPNCKRRHQLARQARRPATGGIQASALVVSARAFENG